MAFDGAGTFLRLYSWLADATAGVKIRADKHDDEDNNFAAGLSNCITKDGQTAVTQNIPMNSRRIISLADPIDPQDAATKDYADTKMPLDGSVPIIGDVTIKKDAPQIILNGKPGFNNGIYGQKNDKNRWSIILGNAIAETGGDTGSDFQLVRYADDGITATGVLYGYRSTGLVVAAADPTTPLGIVTKQYADAGANNATAAANTKLPLAGGTITGNLQVNGYITAASNVLYFSSLGSLAYLQWNGGGTYTLGGGGTVWHSGNFNPVATGIVSDVRLSFAADDVSVNGAGMHEPYAGAVVTGLGFNALAIFARFRYLQTYKAGVWYTVGYSP